MNEFCPFCDTSHAEAAVIHQYNYWTLFVQPERKRAKTKQAAGFLASKRHFGYPIEASLEEWTELKDIIKDASKRLCTIVGVTYSNQETVGFNQGLEAGQTVEHAHVHILPVASEDPEELKIRGGIGGAFEALRKERLQK